MSTSYRQISLDDRWDAIVIGSGMGGLATASMLARHAGKRVLVFERHYTAGGFTHAFRRPGWEWDVGVHYVGQIESKGGVGPLFDDVSGGRLRWARMPEVYDRVVLGDRSFDLRTGKRAFVDTLAAEFPRESETLREHVSLVQRAAGELAPAFVARALPSTLARVVSGLVGRRARHWLDRTTEEVLRPRIRDPLLYRVLTAQAGDYGLPPREGSFGVHAMVAGHYLEGAYYPIGGASAIAESIEPEIEKAGGRVIVRAEVTEIVIERGRAVGVRMAEGGRVLRAPVIVSDVGARNTWLSLVPREQAEPTGLPAAIRRVAPSVAHLSLYLGLEGTDRELGLTGTNLWIYPEASMEESFARFRADPSAPFPVVYASFPSSKDPTWGARHPGRSTIELITPAWPEWLTPHAGTRWHKRGAEYDAWKSAMSERLLAVLERHRPGLAARVIHQELSTPLSTAHFTAHGAGEMYGLAHTPDRFRLPLRAATPIPGLYFTGQDLVSCGVAGALSGAAITAAAILSRDLRSVARTLRHRGASRPTPSAAARARPRSERPEAPRID